MSGGACLAEAEPLGKDRCDGGNKRKSDVITSETSSGAALVCGSGPIASLSRRIQRSVWVLNCLLPSAFMLEFAVGVFTV